MAPTHQHGDRVQTPFGPGTVDGTRANYGPADVAYWVRVRLDDGAYVNLAPAKVFPQSRIPEE